MIIKNDYLVLKDFENTRIDKWIKLNINKFPQSYIEKILRKKKITVNKKKVLASYNLKLNDKIYVRLNYKFSEKKDTFKYVPTKKDIKDICKDILYQNEDYIVLSKPSGIAVQSGTKTGKNVIDILNYKNNKFFIVHRLDKDTSGLLLIAKNRYTARYLSEQFSLRQIKKKYLAILKGEFKEKSGKIVSKFINKNKNKNLISISDFKILSRNKFYTLIDINLITGRKHQIRKQFKDLNYPIVGDKIYGKKENVKLMLHSYMIEFKLRNKKMTYKSEIPEYFLNFLKKINLEIPLRNF